MYTACKDISSIHRIYSACIFLSAYRAYIHAILSSVCHFCVETVLGPTDMAGK